MPDQDQPDTAPKSTLGEPTPLDRNPRQSSGPLYQLFLNGAKGRILKFHHYFDIYERHLGRFVGRSPKILEIGLGHFGSSLMWTTWFGDGARLVGVDIKPEYRRESPYPQICFEVGDQADPAFLGAVAERHGPFDIVIDDGGHTARQQINTFNRLYDHLTDDGVFLCEDTHTSYLPGYMDAGEGVTMVEHAKKMIDRLHEPYQQPGAMERFFGPMDDREGAVVTSRFAARTKGIFFYDSVIVFERGRRSEPWCEKR